MAIVSSAEFDAYIRDELGATDAAMRAQALAAAIGIVKKYCARSFELTAAAATPRVFIPDDARVLRVPDFCDTASLIVSNYGTIVAASGYQLEPLNGLDLTGGVVPYEQIRLLSSYWYKFRDQATITITAKWGWTTIPGEVVEAVKLLGKDWVQQRSTTLSYVNTAAGPAGTGGRNWAALNALGPWRRAEAFGIA